MAGKRTKDAEDSPEGGGVTSGGTSESDGLRKRTNEEEVEEQADSASSSRSDTSDKYTARSTDAGVDTDSRLNEKHGGGNSNPPAKASSYFLIYEDTENSHFFSVLQRTSLADVAREAANMPGTVTDSAVLIRGERLPFRLEQRTTFSCSDDEVQL